MLRVRVAILVTLSVLASLLAEPARALWAGRDASVTEQHQAASCCESGGACTCCPTEPQDHDGCPPEKCPCSVPAPRGVSGPVGMVLALNVAGAETRAAGRPRLVGPPAFTHGLAEGALPRVATAANGPRPAGRELLALVCVWRL